MWEKIRAISRVQFTGQMSGYWTFGIYVLLTLLPCLTFILSDRSVTLYYCCLRNLSLNVPPNIFSNNFKFLRLFISTLLLIFAVVTVSAFKSSRTIMWPFLPFNLLRFSPFPYSYSKCVSLKNTSVTIIFFTFALKNISHILSSFLVLSVLSIKCFPLQNAVIKSDAILYLFPIRLVVIRVYYCVHIFLIFTSAILFVFLVVFLTVIFISVLHQFFFRFGPFCLSFLDPARRV
jgi:hypothetical protein